MTAIFSSSGRARSVVPTTVSRLRSRTARSIVAVPPPSRPTRTSRPRGRQRRRGCPPAPARRSGRSPRRPPRRPSGQRTTVGEVLARGVDPDVEPVLGRTLELLGASARCRRRCSPSHGRAGTAAVPTPLPTAWIRTRSPGRRPACVSSASCAVRKTSGTAAASSKSRFAGIGTAIRSGVTSVLGLPPAGDDPEDPVADLERPGHARPERIDLAGVLQPRDVGRRPPAARVIAPGLHQVGPVQPARPHPDPDLVALRLGRRHSRTSRTSGPPGLVMTMAFISRGLPLAPGRPPRSAGCCSCRR